MEQYKSVKELAEKDIHEFAKTYAMHELIKRWFITKDKKVLEEIKGILKNGTKKT